MHFIGKISAVATGYCCSRLVTVACDWLLLLATGFACDWLLLLATGFAATGYCCLRLVTVARDWFCLRLVGFACDLLLLLATGFACDWLLLLARDWLLLLATGSSCDCGRHSNPVVTTPMIALDFSGMTQQSTSHNVAPNQISQKCTAELTASNQLSHGFVNARQKDSTQVLPSYAGTNNKSKVQNNEECSPKSLDPQEKRTAQISPKASNINSFAPLLQHKFRVQNG
ncbi:hypothetical protein F511_21521 [Dorcoceras hygrometricum]|uniref:Uncharacterized protein n=1 Tax=Dorcoceras hygrometricum TaxID=472368 RepID=A0A2Z7CAG7_9LAMI|nr:hypothetical protein F511_21521 [Dorcoceras hygrometricum]